MRAKIYALTTPYLVRNYFHIKSSSKKDVRRWARHIDVEYIDLLGYADDLVDLNIDVDLTVGKVKAGVINARRRGK
tara:strand:- start:231 stop:458 length:228 start_codon:yes stop_codon:yes gene_type:complete